MTTNHYIQNVKQDDWQPFRGKLWQRSYWEHIIRSEEELNQIREYIHYNPAKWDATNQEIVSWDSHNRS